MIGERLGHYRIEARLGAGGMGVVYRAHDERLQRSVAIKLIDTVPGGSTPENRARLLDEARAASALGHPNICTVFEVGEAGARTFIAMEYVDGRPLSQLIPHGGLPAETAVRYGVQIAGALAHAHDHGVIHRDLKSSNVVVSADGTAKVLDFGLARRIEAPSENGVTRSAAAPRADTLAGTLPYLAPELLLGKEADARSDIWSLGIVLFEITTGELPFAGLNEFDVMGAILRAPPKPFPAHVPAMLRAVILHCLAKEPSQRYRRAGEVRAALEAMESDVSALPKGIMTMGARRRRAWTIAAAAAAIVALAGAGWFMRTAGRSPWQQPGRFTHLTRLVSSVERTFDPALSPDGGMLCYAMEVAPGRVDLFAGRTAGGTRLRLTDDDAIEESPRFSPDGERIAFTRRGGRPDGLPEIRIVPALGGDVISSIPRAAYPSWSPDGRRLAYVYRSPSGRWTEELTIASSDGSAARTVVRSDGTYPFIRYPAWSPDGKTLAFVRGAGGVAGEIWTVGTDGSELRRLLVEPAAVVSDSAVFTPDGRGIIHSSNRGGATNIWVVPTNGGTPVRLTSGPGPDESPTVSATGTIAFVNSRWRGVVELHDLSSRSARHLAAGAALLWAPSMSPDGTRVAYSQSEMDGSWHVWVVPVGGGPARRLTSTDAGEVYPRWSRDGNSVFFYTWNTPHRIGRVSATGGAPTLLSFGADASDAFADVSPDGRQIAFARAQGDGERVFVGPADGGAPRMLSDSPGTTPQWSPDGRRIAFAAARTYTGGIFVADADGRNVRRLAATGGWPTWWPDGSRIGYLAIDAHGDQELHALRIDGTADEALKDIRLVGTNHPFTVTPDGRSIVVANTEHVSDEIWLLDWRK